MRQSYILARQSIMVNINKFNLIHYTLMNIKTHQNQYDHLSSELCDCKICNGVNNRQNPQINFDQHYHALKTQRGRNLSTYNRLQGLRQNVNGIQGFEWYLRKLAYNSNSLPGLAIVDTMIMQKGQMLFYVFSEQSKMRLHFNSLSMHPQSKCKLGQNIPYSLGAVRQKLLQRKVGSDIQYQKRRYKQMNPSFEWAQLDHESQKLIKQFEKRIRFTDQVLNRMAIIKQYSPPTRTHQPKLRQSMITSLKLIHSNTHSMQIEQKTLSKYEFTNLFDKTRVKVCEMTDIGYVQLFPVMYGEEENSRIVQIKYFRHLEYKKEHFRLAQNYVISWLEKNEALQKMQHQFVNRYFYSEQNLKHSQLYPHSASLRLELHVQRQYLTYLSYKILLHLQMQANVEVSQCLLEFITIDDGVTYYLKQINYIKYLDKPQVQIKSNHPPKYKSIDPQYYIPDLQHSMRQVFESVEDAYQRLNRDWQIYQKTKIKDKQQSDRVFKAGLKLKHQAQLRANKSQHINKLTDSLTEFQTFTPPRFHKQTIDESSLPTLHQILNSNDKFYKKQMLLGRTAKFKNTTHPHNQFQ